MKDRWLASISNNELTLFNRLFLTIQILRISFYGVSPRRRRKHE